jgi:hypothetical protein
VFASVIRSVDDGLPIDTARIRDRTEAALGNGALRIALAQGEILIAAGQLRLTNTAIQAKGVELAGALGVDLSGGTIDARLVLSGAPGTGALEGIRPEIAVALRGPFDAPKRTVDVVAFTSWLALRAVEEKDKRIEALQRGHETPAAPSAPAPNVPVPSAPAPSAPVEIPRLPPQRPAAKAPSPPPTDIRPPAATKPHTAPKQAQPQRPVSRSWLEYLLGP